MRAGAQLLETFVLGGMSWGGWHVSEDAQHDWVCIKMHPAQLEADALGMLWTQLLWEGQHVSEDTQHD
eukprot:1136845-Pelagomonas_calceolata.AAC.2